MARCRQLIARLKHRRLYKFVGQVPPRALLQVNRHPARPAAPRARREASKPLRATDPERAEVLPRGDPRDRRGDRPLQRGGRPPPAASSRARHLAVWGEGTSPHRDAAPTAPPTLQHPHPAAPLSPRRPRCCRCPSRSRTRRSRTPSPRRSRSPAPPPSPATKWTRRVPHPVLIGPGLPARVAAGPAALSPRVQASPRSRVALARERALARSLGVFSGDGCQ
jgi:hypothetical protein